MKHLLNIVGALALLGALFSLLNEGVGGGMAVLIFCVSCGLARVIELGEKQLELLEAQKKKPGGP